MADSAKDKDKIKKEIDQDYENIDKELVEMLEEIKNTVQKEVTQYAT